MSAAGNYLFAERFGGAGNDAAGDVALDPTGNILTTGQFAGTADFDPGPGVVQLSSGPAPAAFVLKLNAGGAYGWAERLSGTGFVSGNDLVTDASGNVFVTGAFAGTADFDPGPGTASRSSSGGRATFLSPN